MALTEQQFAEIKNELDNCKNPLFFFDDDPDGLCAFLLLYRYKREGKGYPIKSTPLIDGKYVEIVKRYDPDKVFILDIAMVEQEFLDHVKVPVIWIDHHPALQRSNVKYFNPRINDPLDNPSTTVLCYHAVQQDLWLGMIGGVADWQLPDFTADFIKQYPGLLSRKIKKPQDALFNSEVGKLVKIFSFILKGKAQEMMKYVKVLFIIKDPYEILNQTTQEGRYLYKQYERAKKDYDELLAKAIKAKGKDKILLFIYPDAEMSFTKELSNELLYLFPKKIIVIGRHKNGAYKLSLRSATIPVRPVLEKALVGVDGYGGGHEMACGVCIKTHDFEKFLEQFRKNL